jgi:hypothetical protein
MGKNCYATTSEEIITTEDFHIPKGSRVRFENTCHGDINYIFHQGIKIAIYDWDGLELTKDKKDLLLEFDGA